jgi:hypothetical protein
MALVRPRTARRIANTVARRRMMSSLTLPKRANEYLFDPE